MNSICHISVRKFSISEKIVKQQQQPRKLSEHLSIMPLGPNIHPNHTLGGCLKLVEIFYIEVVHSHYGKDMPSILSNLASLVPSVDKYNPTCCSRSGVRSTCFPNKKVYQKYLRRVMSNFCTEQSIFKVNFKRHTGSLMSDWQSKAC